MAQCPVQQLSCFLPDDNGTIREVRRVPRQASVPVLIEELYLLLAILRRPCEHSYIRVLGDITRRSCCAGLLRTNDQEIRNRSHNLKSGPNPVSARYQLP